MADRNSPEEDAKGGSEFQLRSTSRPKSPIPPPVQPGAPGNSNSRSLDDIMTDPFGVGQDDTPVNESVIPSVEHPPTSAFRPRGPFHIDDDAESMTECATSSDHSAIPPMEPVHTHDHGYYDDSDQEPLPVAENNQEDNGTSLFLPDNHPDTSASNATPRMRITPTSSRELTVPAATSRGKDPVQPITIAKLGLLQARGKDPVQPISIGKLGLLKARGKKPNAHNSAKPDRPALIHTSTLMGGLGHLNAHMSRNSSPTHGLGFRQDLEATMPDVLSAEPDNYDMFNKKAEEEFKKKQRHYDRLRHANSGKLSFTDSVAWMKIVSQEQTRQDKLKRDKKMEEQDDNDLKFFSDQQGIDMSASEEHTSNEGIVDPELFTNKRKRPDMPRKEIIKLSLQDAECEAMKVAMEADKDKPEKKKPRVNDAGEGSSGNSGKRTKATQSKPKATTTASRPRVSGGSKKAPTKSTKGKEAERAVKQVASLFGNNIFKQQAPQDAPDQPTTSTNTRNKHEAFKELLASLPVGKKSERSDIHELMRDIQDFDGRGSVVHTGDGMWLVKGMATSMKPYQIQGTAFMRRREHSKEEPRGGLLADQMGLGKTLEMLGKLIAGILVPYTELDANLMQQILSTESASRAKKQASTKQH